ncbi:hypothetical protein PR202_gb11193 [Eleusine coracana subsp. coracana]|uniref:phosphoglucomutase (alpha-D-glucose-1,6-bisphosphate-dependent) n=1 Tax=Eleusine coracana subsp. coracana TaxID=191504 RepID=A0AAV5EMU5_ELECO|nr:hypothetical protein PR202_gb11193 [Eleusine coracana subsp. coracana]
MIRLCFPSSPGAIIPPRPRRHRHNTATPFPSIPPRSRSLHQHRLTPLLASSRGDRRQRVGGPDMVLFTVTKKATTPFEGQKPGTSGLRKKVTVFQQPNYLHNFVQATFNALPAEQVKGATIVVSGDGRYFSKDAVQIITKMAAANGVRRVWVGQHSLMSTPAVSCVIRDRVGADGSKATGAFILTASHNPGGPTEVDISVLLVSLASAGPEGPFDVDVFDSSVDYIKLMKSIFDFEAIKKLLTSPKFTFCYDALHGVAGAYAKRIFVEELGADESSLLNCVPKEDFGGGHPDPNLTYAKN